MRTKPDHSWPAAVLLSMILAIPVINHEAPAVPDRAASVEPLASDAGRSRGVAVLPSVREPTITPSPTRPPEPVRQLIPRPSEPTSEGTGRTVSGVASWFCGGGSPCTRGYGPECRCAAAGPALRVGQWRGRVVTIMAGGHAVQVTLRDWCACGSGRVIDLYRSAFSELADPSRGILKVTVTWN